MRAAEKGGWTVRRYYGVATQVFDQPVFDKPKLVMSLVARDADVKPKDESHETEFFDVYIDWFESKERAVEFMENNKSEADLRF